MASLDLGGALEAPLGKTDIALLAQVSKVAEALANFSVEKAEIRRAVAAWAGAELYEAACAAEGMSPNTIGDESRRHFAVIGEDPEYDKAAKIDYLCREFRDALANAEVDIGRFLKVVQSLGKFLRDFRFGSVSLAEVPRNAVIYPSYSPEKVLAYDLVRIVRRVNPESLSVGVGAKGSPLATLSQWVEAAVLGEPDDDRIYPYARKTMIEARPFLESAGPAPAGLAKFSLSAFNRWEHWEQEGRTSDGPGPEVGIRLEGSDPICDYFGSANHKLGFEVGTSLNRVWHLWRRKEEIR